MMEADGSVPNIRISSPQMPLYLRCWQPIGSTVMDTQVLKEPRGLMRCLEFFFAILAFATLADFSGSFNYSIFCTNDPENGHSVSHGFQYPFRLDHQAPVSFNCSDETVKHNISVPGDFSSDAKFFVFTGVISFLGSLGSIIIYVFFSPLYADESKKPPMIDFWFTLVIAVFWLSASAAWTNGLITLKWIASAEWIFTSNKHPCGQTSTGTYILTKIKECIIEDKGHFVGANISALLGYLNFFLWASNLWFIYKETSWFSNKSGSQPLEG
ncbi:synaptophysin isoform X2 [Lepeophtheirus salmonis]|uniref:synaptophysin isoform X2 n=1 Tax=Lepeophtheirus salmonis TaxID=72036 RepID=UPI001AE68BE9|nr:synaptophysin-like isoform X2 [Lepeophtheirus salmonis]